MTQGRYPLAVGDRGDRRAAQKARTRERILATAKALFAQHGFEAVTIVHVAAEAQVSVQTVFNHFASKEELFFTDRVAWVEGPAAAVRNRPAGVRPKTALRHHLVGLVEKYARGSTTAEHQALIRALAASPSLLAYERGLHEQAVAHLGAALAEAWGCADDDPTGTCSTVLAEVTASIWLAAVRTVLLGLRTAPPAIGDESAVAEAVDLVEQVLGDLDTGLSVSQAHAGSPGCSPT